MAKITNVALYLKNMARIQPYKKAVICPVSYDKKGRVTYTHFTFRQLDQESDCLANGLEKIGITRGIRTILMVKPSLEFFTLIFALFKAGAVPVVVDPGMGIRRMIACLKESRSKALIGIPPAHILRLIYPKFFKSVNIFVTVGKRLFWRGPTLDQLISRPFKPYSIADTRADETAALLFTTGSTGPAKGVIYTHGHFEAQIRHLKEHFSILPGEVNLPTFPLFALFDPALGRTSVIPDMNPTRPAHVNPIKIIEAINNHGVAELFASPALLNRVGRYGKKNNIRLPSLKRVISSGAPVSPDNIERFASLLGPDTQIYTGYGATEAMPVAVMGSNEILAETKKLSERGFGVCIGRSLDKLQVAIIKITDNPIVEWSENILVANGDIGEITVKGELVTRQYFNNARADALSKIKAKNSFWHRMGDLGWKDKKGRIWFCGRKNHRVITSDKTFFTIPCEAVFNSNPNVFRSALVGVGEKDNKIPVICIELEPFAKKKNKAQIKKELLLLAQDSLLTESIKHIFFHKAFPVDIRHNSKIFREKLAVWAEKKL